MGRECVHVGLVPAVVTHGTGLALTGPFLLCCWNGTPIKSIGSNPSGLPVCRVGGLPAVGPRVLGEKRVVPVGPGRLGATLSF